MVIATYFHPVKDIDEQGQRELIELFRSQWEDTVVCGIEDAKQHPRFEELQSLLATYQEVTPQGYRDQCFFRWLAFDQMQHQGPLLILDYDVFSACGHSLEWCNERYQRPTVLNQTNPCAVYLPEASFLSHIVDMLFLPTIPNQETNGLHIGDNSVFGEHWRAIGDCIDIVSTYPETHTGLIHFANRFCPHDKPKIIRETLNNFHHTSDTSSHQF